MYINILLLQNNIFQSVSIAERQATQLKSAQKTWYSHKEDTRWPINRWGGSASRLMPAKSLRSCPTLYNPVDHSPPGSSVHGVLQARRLEWVALPSSRGSSQPRANIKNQKRASVSKDRRCGEVRIFLHCWWECKPVPPVWKTVWQFINKLKIELACYC